MMCKSCANLTDILRAVGFGIGWNWERQRRSAIQIFGIRVTKGTGRRCIFDWKEIEKVVIWVDVFEALNCISLHRQQNGLAAYSRIKHESLGVDKASFHQYVACAIHDILRRAPISDSPARRAKTSQANSIPVFITIGVSCIAVGL